VTDEEIGIFGSPVYKKERREAFVCDLVVTGMVVYIVSAVVKSKANPNRNNEVQIN
jgi:hypothetical protein